MWVESSLEGTAVNLDAVESLRVVTVTEPTRYYSVRAITPGKRVYELGHYETDAEALEIVQALLGKMNARYRGPGQGPRDVGKLA